MEPEDQLAAIETKRAERKAVLNAKKLKQKTIDLEAISALEDEMGDEELVVLEAPLYADGAAQAIAVRKPTSAEYKRFTAILTKAKDHATKVAAAEQLGRACLVYPQVGEFRDLTLEKMPGLISAASNAVQTLGEFQQTQEGKG